MKDYDRILLTGDKHRDFSKLISDSDRYGFTEHDLLIILGDVGVNYFGQELNGFRDGFAKRSLSKLPCTILCIHGNHEMRPTSDAVKEKYRKIDWMGDDAYVEDDFPSLIFASEGSRYTINGRSFLVIGGAYSVDKYYRLAMGAKWFSDEQLTSGEMEFIRQKVKAHGGREDIILAHTCPMNYRPVECFLRGIDESKVDTTMEQFLQEITDSTDYNLLYCGHWHTDKQDGKIRFLFHDIIMLEEEGQE